jgi:hypothetical protein
MIPATTATLIRIGFPVTLPGSARPLAITAVVALQPNFVEIKMILSKRRRDAKIQEQDAAQGFRYRKLSSRGYSHRSSQDVYHSQRAMHVAVHRYVGSHWHLRWSVR